MYHYDKIKIILKEVKVKLIRILFTKGKNRADDQSSNITI